MTDSDHEFTLFVTGCVIHNVDSLLLAFYDGDGAGYVNTDPDSTFDAEGAMRHYITTECARGVYDTILDRTVALEWKMVYRGKRNFG